MPHRSPTVRCLTRPLAALLVLLALAPRTLEARGTITVAVDLTDAPRKVFRSRLVIPADPGVLALSYPKWIPGEHGPTGPLTDVAGLRITAAGRTLTWQRDLEDMHQIRFNVPAGAASVEVEFDFLSAAGQEGFSSAASATQHLALLSWNQVVLYPTGEPSEALTYQATLTLPPGWQLGTALPVARKQGDRVEFEPVSLATLVDSPVLAGSHFRTVDLSPGREPRHYLHIAADSKESLEIPAAEITKLRRLVAEALAMFGAHHYRSYHFLLTQSEHVAHFGLEHHESSDNRVREQIWRDEDQRINHSNLLPHEIVHSWNGKYRRPAGLVTPTFQEPFHDELLWIYEGLTQYLAFVLSARSDVRGPDLCRQNLALQAAYLDHRPGRAWRPLIDTAVEAQLLFEAAPQWDSYRRRTDFYNEGMLIWLEADVTIRKLTRGRRSLDDFLRRFFGPPSGPPKVVPYTLDAVIRAMNEVARHDWRRFFAERVEAITPQAPLGGVRGAGWRIVYRDSLPRILQAIEEVNEYVDEMFSIGLRVKKDGGDIVDVVVGMPAAKAGVGPGMKLVAVNGRKWSKRVLRDAIKASATGALELLVDNGEFYRTFRIDYRGGLRHPHLERAPETADLLSLILRPLRPGAR